MNKSQELTQADLLDFKIGFLDERINSPIATYDERKRLLRRMYSLN